MARQFACGQALAHRHTLPAQRVLVLTLMATAVVSLVATTPARAGVAVDGSVVSTSAYVLDLDGLDTRADGVGGRLSASDPAGELLLSSLVLSDGTLACGATTPRTCEQVATTATSLWVLFTCLREQTCSLSGATVRATATSLLSLYETRAHVSTSVRWTLQDGTAPVLLAQPFVVAGTAALADNTVAWLEPTGAGLTQSSLDGWGWTACALPFTAQLAFAPPADGLLTLATHATTASLGPAGAIAAECGSTVESDDSIRLSLARLTPTLDDTHRFSLVLQPTSAQEASSQDLTMLAAAVRGAMTSSPTVGVEGVRRWLLDDRDGTTPDDFREDLGLAFLALDGAAGTTDLSWDVGPIEDPVLGTVPRDNPAWLLRGRLQQSATPLQVFKINEGVIDAVANLVMEPVQAAAIRVHTPAKVWEPFTPGASMCAKGTPRYCLEVASHFPFTGIEIALASGFQNIDLSWQYWSADLRGWADLVVALDSTAARFEGSGYVRWSLPDDWGRMSASGTMVPVPLYWIRVTAQANFAGDAPVAASIVPDLLFVQLRERITESTRLLLSDDSPPVAAVAQANIDAEPHEPVVLDGNPSEDPDGDELTFEWVQTSGETVQITSGATEALLQVTPPAVGLYGFRLTVSAGPLQSSTHAFVRVGTAVALPRGTIGFRGCASSTAWGGGVATLVALLLVLLGFRCFRDAR